jgi:chromosome segregation ATPase
VKSGELLAEVDKKNVLTQIEIAKINFINAELKLKKVKENTADIEIKKAQLEYEKAQKDLENKKSNLVFFEKDLYAKLEAEKKSLEQKKLSLVIIQKEVEKNIKEINNSPNNQTQSLDQLKNKLETLEREFQRDTKNFDLNLKKKQNENAQALEKEYLALQSSLNSLSKNFQELDKLFRLKTDTSANDDFMIYFSAKNTSYKNKAGNYFAGAYAKFKIIEEKFNNLNGNYTIDDIVSLSKEQVSMYEDLYIASDNMMK